MSHDVQTLIEEREAGTTFLLPTDSKLSFLAFLPPLICIVFFLYEHLTPLKEECILRRQIDSYSRHFF